MEMLALMARDLLEVTQPPEPIAAEPMPTRLDRRHPRWESKAPLRSELWRLTSLSALDHGASTPATRNRATARGLSAILKARHGKRKCNE